MQAFRFLSALLLAVGLLHADESKSVSGPVKPPEVKKALNKAFNGVWLHRRHD